MKIKLSENKLKQIVAESVKRVLRESREEYYKSLDESVNKVLKESYGYDAYPQSGYEEFSRIGENYAHEVMKELCTKYKREDIDAECISRIVNQFKDALWALVEVGNEHAGIKGFGIKDSQYN